MRATMSEFKGFTSAGFKSVMDFNCMNNIFLAP